MSEPTDLLTAGLLSHGFKELTPEGEWRHFGYRRGREDRWLRESDCLIWIGDGIPPGACACASRMQEDSVPPPTGRLMASDGWVGGGPQRPTADGLANLFVQDGGSYHRLLRKCGEIYLRTRKRAEEERISRLKPQKELFSIDLQEELKELMK